MTCNDLPAAISIHPYISVDIVSAIVPSLVLAFLCLTVGCDRRISENSDLEVVQVEVGDFVCFGVKHLHELCLRLGLSVRIDEAVIVSCNALRKRHVALDKGVCPVSLHLEDCFLYLFNLT